MRPAAGIYVHLPYCASRCGYCAFVVTTDASSREAYLRGLEREAQLLETEASGSVFDSVYFGGGTPSLVPPAAIARLLDMLRSRFAISDATEVTLEANPEDVTAPSARSWIQAGINRVSVGVQSLDDAELSGVGRRHDAAQARSSVATAVGSGASVSADLILGLPEQTAESFRRSLEGLLETGVGHVSVYLLETEKSRTLEEDRVLRPERYLSDDAQADLWLELCQTLRSKGFHHYEISNWALPGQEARHNLKYWRRTPTLGLGVSAHEFWVGRRRANVSNLERYVAGLEEGRRPLALDRILDGTESAREEIFLGLRLSEGVPAARIEAWIEASQDVRLSEDYGIWIGEELLSKSDGGVRFTERGFLVSNEVLSRFV